MRVNVSSINSFASCRFRWWCEWVMNRVPVATSPALDAGRLLHEIFEDHARGIAFPIAVETRCHKFRQAINEAHPSARGNSEKAVQQIEDLGEALPMWEDKFPITRVLEIEEPFEMPDGDIIWLGRPDRVVGSGRKVWHVQNRGLAAGMNFGTYTRLAKRHYHEHLYAEWLAKKYPKWKYGGTVFNLVRKLKYRTNVGKKNEATKTPEEMFWQGSISIDLTSPLHNSVMMSMRQHVSEMRRVLDDWNYSGIIPAPNEKMNGGYGGNSEDPYFRVLIGEIKLSDDNFFKDRIDMYSTPEEG